jgi:putative oxidoreductase
VLLITRVAVGVVFGWQKFTEWGLSGIGTSFDQMGVPLPTASAWFAAIVELVGGVALIAGITVPVVGLLLALASTVVLFAVVGAGRYSIDRLIAPRLPQGLRPAVSA